MPMIIRIALGAALALPVACSNAPPPEPQPVPESPVEAFEQVGEPQRDYTGAGRNDPDNLSSDIERLQDARRKYDKAQDQRAAQRARAGNKCPPGQTPREVAIEDGAEASGRYCQPQDKPANEQGGDDGQ